VPVCERNVMRMNVVGDHPLTLHRITAEGCADRGSTPHLRATFRPVSSASEA
jgi:hypothetical protein